SPQSRKVRLSRSHANCRFQIADCRFIGAFCNQSAIWNLQSTMMDASMLAFLAAPFVASLILTGIHAYLGVHVVERGVIFVDLALAQIAALGATIALL